jgi:maltooligosyltrehalose trehalohydrolase
MESLSPVRDGSMTKFRIWAPLRNKMLLQIEGTGKEEFEMAKDDDGFFNLELEDLPPFSKYLYKPDEEDGYPDPASAYQPEGVHGPSEIVDHDHFEWRDKEWKGIKTEDLVLYELHVGTFTKEGTFEAIIDKLDDLKDTGINALELMPVAQFPGERNWGYDGVFPYAVQNSYGGPEGLKKLVDACHAKGIAVILDVVYNHLGPEGNYLEKFGPYFTDQYKTPWGKAVNFDGEYADGVREFFSDNPVYWFRHYHVDGLRVDAIHTIYDNSAVSFWELVSAKIRQLENETGRKYLMIAESDLNSPRVIKEATDGGYGFDAQWLDDFHHALYVKVDRKGIERYYDFGRMDQLAKAYKDGFVHSGEYVKFRKRKHGKSSAGIPGNKFVAFNMNHDQVGNRVHGERLCMLVNDERLKLATAALLLSPYIPMLFMGEEYADRNPFYYFVSHSDKELIELVRKGRKEEFKDFGFDQQPPDPQDEKTFTDSKIDWEKRQAPEHRIVLQWHKKLLEMRRTLPALRSFDKQDIDFEIIDEESFLLKRKSSNASELLFAFFNFSEEVKTYVAEPGIENAGKILDSNDLEWREPAGNKKSNHPTMLTKDDSFELQPLSVVVYYSKH